MRKFLSIVLLMIFCFCSKGFANSEIRNLFNIEGNIQNAKIDFGQEFRSNEEELYYHHSCITVNYKVVKFLSLGADYMQIYSLKNDSWKAEQTPSFIVSISQGIIGFTINDKNKLEMRFRKGMDNTWRNRNTISLDSPLKLTDWKIGLYCSNEFFYDEDGYNRNRFTVGTKFTPTKMLSLELFGMMESNKKDELWENIKILGTKVRTKF